MEIGKIGPAADQRQQRNFNVPANGGIRLRTFIRSVLIHHLFDQHLNTPPVSGLCPRTSRLFHHKRLPKKTILWHDV